MARIKYTGLISSINGSIGGTTFQRNRYGSTVKQKPVTVNPNSAKQNTQKLYLQTASTRWRGLTEAERESWNTWAAANPTETRLNPDAYLNGFNLFCKYHITFAPINTSTILPEPDFTIETLNTITLTCTNSGGDLIFYSTFVSSAPTFLCMLHASGPVNPASYVSKKRCLYFAANPADINDQTFNITSLYIDTFGAVPATGEYITAYLTFINGVNAQIIETPIFKLQVL
jgi:hypothetical protein